MKESRITATAPTTTTTTTNAATATDIIRNVDILSATLPIVAVEQGTCCNTNQIIAVATTTTKIPTNTGTITIAETTTTATNTTATTNRNHTSASIKGRSSIFSWLKSATKAVEHFNNRPLAANEDTVPSLTTTTTTVKTVSAATSNQITSIPATVTASLTAETTTLISDHREFRGVQSLRYLWNKRISSNEAINTKTRIANVKAKKLNKSISCLVGATTTKSDGSNIDAHHLDGNAQEVVATKEGETRTKRTQSLHDCTQLTTDFISEIENQVDLPRIDTLRREKDNFYKYKTAEQASKQRMREPRHATTSHYRLSAGIVSSVCDNSIAARTGFPAIKTSERGERIHWLPRNEITMTAKGHEEVRDVIQQQNQQNKVDDTSHDVALSANCDDSISQEIVLLACDADNNAGAIPNSSPTKTSECNGSTSSPMNCSRTRKHSNATARKYSFKTHAKSYHLSPRNRIKADGTGAATSGGGGGGAGSYSMVAKLTQQFNEIIQKDKSLLQEVKRNNGVLMSRGGHVYKVIDKRDHQQSRISPGISRTSSRAKDLHSTSKTSSCVRHAVSKFESGSSTQKPEVPAKSLQVLRKREELVSKRNKQCNLGKSGSNHNKRILSMKQTSESDKVIERPIKLELNTLEVVTEESKTPLDGDERSIIEAPSMDTFKDEANDGQSGVQGAKRHCQQNRETERNLINEVNIIRVNENGHTNINDNDIEIMTDIVTQRENKIIIHVVHESTSTNEEDRGLGRKNPTIAEGEIVDKSKVETLALKSVVNHNVDYDENSEQNQVIAVPLSTSFTTVRTTNTEGKFDEEIDEEKLKQRKNRYAKIYEKFRFRSPFHGIQNKKIPSGESVRKCSQEKELQAVTKNVTMTENQNVNAPEAKILAALDVVDQRLKGLAAEPTTSILLRANDDFEQRLLPNSSFIYQSTTKKMLGNKLIVTQAVNVTLVNTIAGEGEELLNDDGDCHLIKGDAHQLEKVIEIETSKSLQTVNSCDVTIEKGNIEEDVRDFESGTKILELHEMENGANEMKSNEKEMETESKDIREISSENERSTSEKDERFEKEEVREMEQIDLVENKIEEEETSPEESHFEETNKNNDRVEEEVKHLVKQPEEYQINELSLDQNDKKLILDNQNEQICYNNDKTAQLPEANNDHLSPHQSFVFNSIKKILPISQKILTSDISEEIYQTLDEAKSNENNQSQMCPSSWQNDYESIAGSSEHSTPIAGNCRITSRQDSYDGYESFEPPSPEREILPPKLPLQPPPLVRNTTDELPALPEPKRKLPKTSLPLKQLTKQARVKSQNTNNATCTLTAKKTSISPTRTSSISHRLITDANDDDQHYYADDENIYDTIKGSHCYESLQTLMAKCPQKSSPKSLDNVSLNSNCYEIISHYRRPTACTSYGAAIPLRNAGSTSTISSDQKTNSLYEVSLVAGMPYGVGSSAAPDILRRRGDSGSGSGDSSTGVTTNVNGNHYSTHSNAASSEAGNSDEWIDITDNEADDAVDDGVGGDGGGDKGVKQQFIVIRERTKIHRSPDWSKRVRDKRLQQKKSISCIEDDSDHYYESLSPSSNNKRYSTPLVERMNIHNKRDLNLPRYTIQTLQPHQHRSVSAHALGQVVSDDYDSFDTDTDDIYESEDHLKNHHDSGVDICNVKLPDPPSSTNQVYAMVKRLKNLISNKKAPNGSKYGGSQQKIYENTSQFYVEGNIYQDSPNSAKCTIINGNKQNTSNTKSQMPVEKDVYENAEFHAPVNIISTAVKHLSTSEKNLSTPPSEAGGTAVNTKEVPTAATTPRSKSKSGKSFKSRLRKSLVGSSFESKQLSILTPMRSTFYLDASGSGELDSGFSEKFSMADLNGEHPADFVNTSSEAQQSLDTSRKTKKESKLTHSQRRRTTIGLRPHEPPPPPPPNVSDGHRMSKSINSTSTTSWYAECGVFKSTALHEEHSLYNSGTNSSSSGKNCGPINQRGSMATSPVGCHTSWYAEAGLYQTSGASVASSSGSSGVSTGNEACEGIGDDMPHSLFQNEPLYQIYSAAKLQSISRDIGDHENDSSTDGYEEIGQLRPENEVSSTENSQRYSRPSALQLVGPKSGPARTLWSEIPEVINSGILPTLTPRERGLQEAKFEIITSEASYLKSLNLLRTHFMNHPVFRDTSVVNARDRKSLFSHIVPVHECSERLLTALESCWQDNIMLLGLSKRIYAIAEKYFSVYISFCEHQGRMDRTLRRLKESKGTFSQNLDILESSPTCCGLNLHSFLMLPMQRITRLPLLIDAVFSKTNPNDDEYESWKMTLAIMNKIVAQCNEAANRCEQAHEIERIARQLEFPTTVRALAIAPVGVTAPGTKPRFLVKKGELTHLIWRGDDAKLTFGKKFTKTSIFAFLFSDLLVLTKRKSEEQFQVFDYCPRNMLTISSGDLLPQLPTKEMNQNGKNLILMTLLENHERKTIELVLSCPSVSEQERWLQAMRPPEAETPGEKLYEEWDCPQVVAKHHYDSKEPDALNLEVGDVVNVTRKLPDGWYQGERIRDGAVGWFPGNHTEEVNSAHVRARNLKQRYRLLTFTASYLETQKRK